MYKPKKLAQQQKLPIAQKKEKKKPNQPILSKTNNPYFKKNLNKIILSLSSSMHDTLLLKKKKI